MRVIKLREYENQNIIQGVKANFIDRGVKLA